MKPKIGDKHTILVPVEAEIVEITDEVKFKYWTGPQYNYFSIHTEGWEEDDSVLKEEEKWER